jgi:pimeloyl-ACP methyl ester carboxylesterase
MRKMRNLIAERRATRLSRRAAVTRVAGVTATLAMTASGLGRRAVAVSSSSFAITPEGTLMSNTTPEAVPVTAVLVHGAFADASNWSGVIPMLKAAGVAVEAPANPLRGITHDADYIASVTSQIPGPVVLVGHSYGGAVITNAGSRADNVRGLVYVGAFIPDEGETLQGLAEQATDSKVFPALRPSQYPNGAEEPGVEFTLDPGMFHDIFCADLPAALAEVMAVSQRPLSGVAFGEPTQHPAWRSLPTWAVVSPSDFIIGPAGERQMAERAEATITEVDASHAMMISQPRVVADVILDAVNAVS